MTDIIKRLQNLRFVLISLDEIQTVNEAIEEIERLRAKLADPREEERKRVADEASKEAVVQPAPTLAASLYLADVLEKKGWVRR